MDSLLMININTSSETNSSNNISKKKTKEFGLTRFKSSTYNFDKETNSLLDLLKDIHELNDYKKECKKPIQYNGNFYLKSSINNYIYDFDNDGKLVGSWDNINKKIDFRIIE